MGLAVLFFQRLSVSRRLDFLTNSKLSRSLNFFDQQICLRVLIFWPFVFCFWSPVWFINDGNLISKTFFGPFPFGVTMTKTFYPASRAFLSCLFYSLVFSWLSLLLLYSFPAIQTRFLLPGKKTVAVKAAMRRLGNRSDKIKDLC